LGCGRNINHIPYCEFEDHDKAIFIDKNSHIAPDVLTNINNLEFWRKIPSRRFQIVADHTNMRAVIFEQADTLKEIYRVLKPGGSFSMLEPIKAAPTLSCPISQSDFVINGRFCASFLIIRIDTVFQIGRFVKNNWRKIGSFLFESVFRKRSIEEQTRKKIMEDAGFVIESEHQTVFYKK